jgi:hypothetical protein
LKNILRHTRHMGSSNTSDQQRMRPSSGSYKGHRALRCCSTFAVAILRPPSAHLTWTPHDLRRYKLAGTALYSAFQCLSSSVSGLVMLPSYPTTCLTLLLLALPLPSVSTFEPCRTLFLLCEV